MKAVVYTGTKNLYGEMVGAVKSLLKNSSVDMAYFLTENDEFPYPLPECVKNINIKDITEKTFPESSPNANTQFKPLCLMRAACAKFLPKDLDMVLQLDVDTIVRQDIADLWNLPMEGKYFAAVPEYLGKYKPYGDLYYNAGVMLLNLKEIRKSHIDNKIIKLLQTEKLPYIDQDAWNKLAINKSVKMPVQYNETFVTGQTGNTYIEHFAGNVFWKLEPAVKKYKALPWSMIRGGLCTY